MSLISFSIVFLVCIGLMLMMMALKHISAALDKPKEAKTAASAVSPQPAVTLPVKATAVADDEEEIVAVITAAIMAACGTGVRIMSVTPAPPKIQASAWRMTGILQNGEGLS